MNLTVYQTDAGGYLVATIEADPDPLDPQNHLIPGGCVTAPPPVTGLDEAAHWDGLAWSKRPDKRGKKYFLADGSEHEVAAIGQDLPSGATETRPPKPLALAKADKIAELKSARTTAIMAHAHANGTTWPNDPDFLERLAKLIKRAASGTPLPANIRDVNYDPVPVTAALLMDIDQAFYAQKDAAWVKFDSLVGAVKATATVDAVNAIGW
jgi:hypothetical protein